MSEKKYLDLTGLTNFLTKLQSKFADKSHNHNEIYYTESEIDTKIDAINSSISAKADSSHTHSSATTSASGFMSASDKSKLDGIDTGANKYTLPSAGTSLGGVKSGGDVTISSGVITVNDDSHNHTIANIDTLQDVLDSKASSSHTHDSRYYTESEIDSKVATLNSAINSKAASSHTHEIADVSSLQATLDSKAEAGHTHSAATTSAAGFMSTSDKSKLDGIASGANKYVLPVASSSIGGVKSGTDITVDTSGNVSVNNDSHNHSASTITSVNANVITGVIAEANLPSYVDDVLEYNSKSNFPSTGEAGKIYVDTTTNLPYRWGGSAYVEVSSSLALGETSATAYRGDRGKIAYDHSQATGNPHGTTIANISGLQSALDSKANSSHTHNYAGSSSAGGAATTALECTGNSATATLADISKKANTTVAVTTAGTGAAYTATVDGITALTAGITFTMIPHTVSTTISPTLNVNGLGAKNVRMRLTTFPQTTTGLRVANFLSANKPVKMMYDGNFWIVDDVIRTDANCLYGVVPIESGGTDADNAADARVNLGIETPNGTTTSGNADYAEVGEWADGNTNDEDRIGYFVAVDDTTSGATMVKATSTSDVRGVTVASPAFSGNCSDDKFDIQTTTVTNSVTGATTTKVTSATLKKQYDYVAVMGLVSVIDNGTCTINGRCMPNDNGTAVPSPNNMGYQVIDRIDSTHILIAVEPGADMLVRIKECVTELQSDMSEYKLSYTGEKVNELLQAVDEKQSRWDSVSQAGIILAYAGASAPSGYLLCNGRAVSRTTYAALFAVIGTTYGSGDGSNTFNLPDLRGRVAVGEGQPTSEPYEFHRGDKGGECTHTLTVNEIPSHDHKFKDWWTLAAGTQRRCVVYQDSVNQLSGDSVAPTGGGQAHNNVQPFGVVNYIISTGK